MEGKITTVHWLCFIYEIFLGDVSFMSLQKIIIGGFNIVHDSFGDGNHGILFLAKGIETLWKHGCIASKFCNLNNS